MDGVQSNDAGSSLVSITVLSVTPARAGKLFALASVAVDIDGVQILTSAINGASDTDVAAELGMTPARLRKERFKLRRRLGPFGEAF